LADVEIEENFALGVDRRFGRVQIFGAGFFVGGQGASGEGDDFSRVVGDGEHDAVAEFGVHGGGVSGASASARRAKNCPSLSKDVLHFGFVGVCFATCKYRAIVRGRSLDCSSDSEPRSSFQEN
jgi:hypothetical protein